MPKIKHVVFIKSFDYDGELLSSQPFYYMVYDDALQYFIGLVGLLVVGGFSNVKRIDLVSGGHVLFSFSDTRKILNQLTYIIKLNP